MKHRSELPALLVAATLLSGNLLAVTCEGIASLKLPDTSNMIARTVAAGEFSGPESTPTAPQEAEFRKLPAFCRVQGVIRPSSDSNIEFEVGCRFPVGMEDISASAMAGLLVRSITSRQMGMRQVWRRRYLPDMQPHRRTLDTRPPSPMQTGLSGIRRRSLTTATAQFMPPRWIRRTSSLLFIASNQHRISAVARTVGGKRS